jgi:hypothetical protein
MVLPQGPRGVPGRPWSSKSTLAQYFFLLCLPTPLGHTNGSPIYGGYQLGHRRGGGVIVA